jgi:histidine kinase
VTVDPLLHENGLLAGGVHIMYDTTLRRQAEEAKTVAERQLEAQRVLSVRADRLRSLGELAAGISHELNQPLVGVRGLAEHVLIGLERGWDISEERAKEKLRLIVEQADRMSHIVEHVRRFARDAGKLEVCPVQINVAVSGAAEMLAAQVRSHGITLDYDLSATLPNVSVNQYSLEEVVLNLICNARDGVIEKTRGAHSSASGRILLRTRASGTDGREQVKIEVVDNGVGISEDVADRLFEPFFTTKGPDQGTGLGLAISRLIVEGFDGTIDIRSTPGRGTTATVSLPAETQNC